MDLQIPELCTSGRRGFLRAAAWSPLLLASLDQQTRAVEPIIDCARNLLSATESTLAEDHDFVTKATAFPPGFFGFSLGHSHEVQLLLAVHLRKLATVDKNALAKGEFKDLLGLLEADHVALVPDPERIPAPLSLLPDAPKDWSAGKAVPWSLRNADDVHITGNECIDLILDLLAAALLLKDLKEIITKAVWKIVDAKMLNAIEAVVRARDWSGLAELVSSLLEKLASREAIVLIGEIGGAAARKKFLEALASRFVPFVGTVIIVVTVVGLVRANWKSIQEKCLSPETPKAAPHA